MITHYKILHSPYLEHLQGAVQLQIADGWQPHGSLTFGHEDFAQAMIKNDAPPSLKPREATGFFSEECEHVYEDYGATPNKPGVARCMKCMYIPI
jgi:hypothetical protein